jgi:hypothetical protein
MAYLLILDLEIVLVDITISVKIADALGVLTFLAKHRESGREHGSILVSVSLVSVGGIDSCSLVD